MRKPNCFVGFLVFVSVLSSPGAAAQVIEEVVVTAQKRETALQDTPIAITAITAAEIERDQIDDFRDIAARTPSLTFTSLVGFTQLAMRGVGLDLTNLSAETSVALYEDGVYRGASFIQGVPSFDMERIEVLRGPQGTLYGRNATAGAANIITRSPSDAGEFNAALSAGNYGMYKFEAGGSGVLVPDKVSGRVSGIFEERDGFRDNLSLGRDEDDAETKGARGSLHLSPSDQFEVVLRGDYLEQDTSGSIFLNLEESPTPLGITPSNVAGFLIFPDPQLGGLSLADVFGLTFPVASQPVIRDPDDLEHWGDQPLDRTIEQYGYSATLTWTGESVTTRFIAARRENEMEFMHDADGTDILLLSNDAYQKNEQDTFELNLSGTAWNERLDWLVGAYYFQEDGIATFFYDLDALQTTFEAIFGLFGPGQAPLPPGSLTAFGTRLKTGEGSAAPFLDFRMSQDSESVAGFGQATYALTDAMRLTLGARYTEDQKDVHRELTNNLGGTPCDRSDNESWNETTGATILDYRLSDETMVYGSISKGYKAGGFNPGECGAPFDPETIIAYEIGAKSTLADGRLQLNGALFTYAYDDIQVNRFVNNTSSITNAAEAEIMGAELEFVAIAGAGFSFDGGVTWLDTEYAGGASFSDPIAGGDPIGVDGNDLLRSPEWKLYVAGQYDIEAHFGRLQFRVDSSYSDSYYFDVFEGTLPNQSEMVQDSFVITNVRASLETLDGRYMVQAFVENIGDELYAETRQAVGTTGAIVGEFSAPLRYGLRVSARLGQ